jgi:uncharacterized protein (DUF3084 family)
MADWSPVLVAALSGGVVGAFISGVVEVIKTVSSRKVRAATVVDQLSDTAMEQVKQAIAAAEAARSDAHEARAEAREARQEAYSARQEAVEARRAANDARREAMDMSRDLSRLKTAILSPYASIEQLRAMVTDPPSANGSSVRV